MLTLSLLVCWVGFLLGCWSLLAMSDPTAYPVFLPCVSFYFSRFFISSASTNSQSLELNCIFAPHSSYSTDPAPALFLRLLMMDSRPMILPSCFMFRTRRIHAIIDG